VPNVPSCLVSFTDTEGIEHSIRVPAESLYEAAIEAMAAFRRGAFAEMTFWSSNTVEDSRKSAGGRTHRHGGESAVVAGGWSKKS
jgi:hypothetical protein